MVKDYPDKLKQLVRKALLDYDTDAAMYLGHAYDFGWEGVEKDQAEAVYWYRLVTELIPDDEQTGEAMMRLGYFHMDGIPYVKDLHSAIFEFTYVAKIYPKDDDYKKYALYALPECQKRLEEEKQSLYARYLDGDGESAYKLARLIDSHRTADKDTSFGSREELMEYAAEKGYPPAMVDVAGGRSIDGAKQHQYWLKAAEAGESEAYRNMAYQYENGNEFIKADQSLANSYYQRYLSTSNSVQSLNDAGKAYELGLFGLTKDYGKAVSNYEEYLKYDKLDKETLYRLGYLYLVGGPNLIADQTKAFECFRDSAHRRGTPNMTIDPGHAEAKYQLGLCYEKGIGTQIDQNKAFQSYLEAGREGSDWGNFHTARCYIYGIGTQKDNDKASETIDFGLSLMQWFVGPDEEKAKLIRAFENLKLEIDPFGDIEI